MLEVNHEELNHEELTILIVCNGFNLLLQVLYFRGVLKIGWLPINERRDLNLLKSCFKAVHNAETWPDYLNAPRNCAHKQFN